MRTLRTLKPGERGTKRLLARHGASLLCVRYRYDEDTREHLKTVELIVQRRDRGRQAARERRAARWSEGRSYPSVKHHTSRRATI